MLLDDIIRVALASLRAHLLRSLLTMLGIVIGVAAVIAMFALGTGAQNAVRDRITRLGTTVIWVNPQRVNQGGVNTANVAKLTMKDVVAIRERARYVAGVNQQQDRPLQVTWRNRNTNVQITGTGSNFLEVRGFKLADGRMFTDPEDRARRKVAVLGAAVLPELSIDNPATILGERIRIGGRQFTVIGVLADRGVSGVADADRQILIPFFTGRVDVFGNDRIQDIWARAVDENSVELAMGEVQSILRSTHRLRPYQNNDFTIRNQADFLTTLSETTQTFTFLLAGIAAVSLLVGGIGIMNIMLVSVTERTKEIGIRKAVGASGRTILLQFMAEAVVMCVAGGLLGVLTGYGASTVLRASFGWDTAMSGFAVVLSFSVAMVIGLVFGVWPARRAARLDPIVALRYE